MGLNPGGGTVETAVNPWAAYGLNADGSAIAPAAEPTQVASPAAAEMADLKAQLKIANDKLSKLPSDFEGMTKKMSVVDKLVAALAPEMDPKTVEYKKMWRELKDIAGIAAPAFAKQMERYENDPDAGERSEQVSNALAQARLSDLNTSAHSEVMALAKGVFRGLNPAELNEAVYPFESTITEMINANPELSRRFVNGDMSIVREMFQRLAKPHLAGRLRAKQEQTKVSSFPKAPPKGAQSASAGSGDDAPKRDLSTRQGREDFHKQAVGRMFQRASNQSDDS